MWELVWGNINILLKYILDFSNFFFNLFFTLTKLKVIYFLNKCVYEMFFFYFIMSNQPGSVFIAFDTKCKIYHEIYPVDIVVCASKIFGRRQLGISRDETNWCTQIIINASRNLIGKVEFVSRSRRGAGVGERSESSRRCDCLRDN